MFYWYLVFMYNSILVLCVRVRLWVLNVSQQYFGCIMVFSVDVGKWKSRGKLAANHTNNIHRLKFY